MLLFASLIYILPLMKFSKVTASSEFTSLIRKWFTISYSENYGYEICWKKVEMPSVKFEQKLINSFFEYISKCYDIFICPKNRICILKDFGVNDDVCKVLAGIYLQTKLEYYHKNSLSQYCELKKLIDDLKANDTYEEYLIEMSKTVNNYFIDLINKESEFFLQS